MPLWLAAHVLKAVGLKTPAESCASFAFRHTRHSTAMRLLAQHFNLATLSPGSPRPAAAPIPPRIIGFRLLVLKTPKDTERGVLQVKFSPTIARLAEWFDLPQLARDYTLILEPSWTGLWDHAILQYRHLPHPVFVLAPDPSDHQFLEQVGGSIVPIALGPSDWGDPRVAEPYLGAPIEFDVVMNANWAPWKRHAALFRILRRTPSVRRVALIGFPYDNWNKDHVWSLVRHFGLQSRVCLFERLPFDRTQELMARSRVAVLLSLKEGSNRALAESMLCNTPVLLNASHIGGIRGRVVEQTGRIADESQWPQVISDILSGGLRIAPRTWAVANASCVASTSTLNAALRASARRQNEPWTSDIVVRRNSPELAYYHREDCDHLQKATVALHSYLRLTPDRTRT